MTIVVGNKLPNAPILRVTDSEIETVDLNDVFASRRVAIFGMPGAFTSTCSRAHLPNIISQKEQLMDAGLDEIAILTVNDSFVLRAWGRASGAYEAGLTLLGDAGSAFTKAVGLNFTVPATGFYDRSQRYALVVNDGVVEHFLLEETRSEITTSSADALLKALG